MNIIEQKSFKKRLKSKYFDAYDVADPYSDEDTKAKFLNSKPACFIITGKPGAGCTTLAKLFVEEFQCEYVNPKDLIEDHIKNSTDKGKELEAILQDGGAIVSDVVVELLKLKMESPEVAHKGYILDGFPNVCCEDMSPVEQFEILKTFKLQPDYLIYLKIPDGDVKNRLQGLRIDPETGNMYFKQNYDPDLPPPPEVTPPVNLKKQKLRDDNEEEGEEEEEMNDDDEEEMGEEGDEDEDGNKRRADPDFDLLDKETIERLLKRPEDYEDNISNRLALYNKGGSVINDYIDNFNSLNVINLNGNLAPFKNLQQLLERLRYFPAIRPPALVTPLYYVGMRGKASPGEEAEENEGDEGEGDDAEEGMFDEQPPDDTIEDEDELFRELGSRSNPAPGYRWQKSKWATYCPVALFEGNLEVGKPKFSAGFLDNVYILSSEARLKQFIRNPRPYLLPINQPRIPCRIIVTGPPDSGKTSISYLLAQHYDAKIIDVNEIMEPLTREAKQKYLKETLVTVTKDAIEKVKENVKSEIEAKKSEIMADKVMEQLHESTVDAVHNSMKEKLAADNKEPETEAEEIEEEEDNDISQDTLKVNSLISEENRDLPEKIPDVNIEEDDPRVQEIIRVEMLKAEKEQMSISDDSYCQEIEKAILKHDETLQQSDKNGKMHGSWIIDNFPLNKEVWSFLAESEPVKNLIPNQVVVLRDNSDGYPFLLKLWYKNNKETVDAAIASRNQDGPDDNKESGPTDQPESGNENVPPTGPEFNAAKGAIDNWNKEWDSIATMLGNRPVPVEIVDLGIETHPEASELCESIVKELNKMFAPIAQEWTEQDAADQDEIEGEMDEANEEEEEEQEEEEDENEEEENEDEEPTRSKKKPLGDTNYWCPVSLKKQGVLYPGNVEVAAKYLGKVYYFANEDNRDEFLKDPAEFLPINRIPETPPLRLFTLGVKGIGKTTVGRDLADKLKIFHISFHELLQEAILPKNRKKIGFEFNELPLVADAIFPDPAVEVAELFAPKPTETEDTNEADAAGEDAPTADDKETELEEQEEEQEVEMDESENAIKRYLESREPLTEDILDELLSEFWTKEPYKSIGFVMEGFPKTSSDVQFLQSRGLFPDGVLILKSEDNDFVIDRLLKPLMDKWKQRKAKKDLYELKMKEYKKNKKNLITEKRRQLIIEELAAKRAAKAKIADEAMETEEDEEEAAEDEEDVDDEVDIDEMLAEKYGDEEEEEEEEAEEDEEETEEEYEERIRGEIEEVLEQDSQELDEVVETLQEAQIPRFNIDAEAKVNIVQYRINKKLSKFLDRRESLFERAYPLSLRVALQLIKSGYKQPSCFGNWCPIKLNPSPAISSTAAAVINSVSIDAVVPAISNPVMPVLNAQNPTFPVLYRSYIYFCSSKKAREEFINNPLKFLKAPIPKHSVPVKLCLLGLLKTGKTTIANRFIREYSLTRVTAGEALRKLLTVNWNTELAKQIRDYLVKGTIVPHSLIVKAIDVMLMDVNCVSRGYVLDGYPMNIEQARMLETHGIVPNRIYELVGFAQDMMMRASRDRQQREALGPTVYPLPRHDSPKIEALKMAVFDRNIAPIREWYGSEYLNYRNIDSTYGNWLLWERINNDVVSQIVSIQNYLYRRNLGEAAGIHDLGVRPTEFLLRMSAIKQYCPVNLAERGELVNMEQEIWSTILRYSAEYKGLYYSMAGPAELADFLRDARGILERASKLPDHLPSIVAPDKLEQYFPKKLDLQGYCPVCFSDGKCRYEGLVLGNRDRFVIEYRDSLFTFCTENCMNVFMRLPGNFWDLKLPKKLPPIKNPVNIRSLPLPGYLEQTMADALRNALTATGTLKPKYPFINQSRSALLYIALHLKAFNPSSPDYLRKKYKKKLEKFEEHCELIRYLSDNMTLKFKEVEQRPVEFDKKMNSFLELKQSNDNEDRWINSE